jgi:hypothetical protein
LHERRCKVPVVVWEQRFFQVSEGAVASVRRVFLAGAVGVGVIRHFSANGLAFDVEEGRLQWEAELINSQGVRARQN